LWLLGRLLGGGAFTEGRGGGGGGVFVVGADGLVVVVVMMMIHTGQALLLFGEDGLPTTLAKQLVIRRIRTAHDGLLVSSSLVVKKNYGICRAEVCGSALESEERASWQKGNVHGVVIVIITAVVVVRWWWCGGGGAVVVVRWWLLFVWWARRPGLPR
jgi:hypothetical protein